MGTDTQFEKFFRCSVLIFISMLFAFKGAWIISIILYTTLIFVAPDFKNFRKTFPQANLFLSVMLILGLIMGYFASTFRPLYYPLMATWVIFCLGYAYAVYSSETYK